jgi:hypothetical protein
MTRLARAFAVALAFTGPDAGAWGDGSFANDNTRWAAAGLMDTWLRWKIEPEVAYGNEAAFQPGVQG